MVNQKSDQNFGAMVFVIIIIIVILWWFFATANNNESFNVLDTSNWVPTGANSRDLEYGQKYMPGMYSSGPEQVMGPSQNSGVGQNSIKDVYDNRGFKWAAEGSNPEVDVFTNQVDNAQLRNKFERTYMLDPDGGVAKYDLSYNEISPNCCPAQYSPPFKVTDKDSSNCDYAQKFVANNYSGMNFKDGLGCVCVTPKQADFYGSRGGNTD